MKFIANREAVHVDITNDISLEDMERVHFGYTTYYHIIAIQTASYLSSEYLAGQRANKVAWERFAGYRARDDKPPIMRGADMTGLEIEPLGVPYSARETGISVPIPGKPWKPVRVEESSIVRSRIP